MEYIKVNGTEYECKSVTTGINSISFTMDGKNIEEVHEAFKDVICLEVAGADKVTYGIYGNLYFASATVYEDGTVGVTMNIKSDMEIRLDVLEETQELQDEAIVELAEMIGGE